MSASETKGSIRLAARTGTSREYFAINSISRADYFEGRLFFERVAEFIVPRAVIGTPT